MLATREELGRMLLQQQGLLGGRRSGGLASAVAWIRRQGFLPLELQPHALAASHDLVLFERLSGYRAGLLEMALHDRERVFEHCLHIPGALPAADYRLVYDPEREDAASRPGSIGALVLELLADGGPSTLRELQAELRARGLGDRRAMGRAVYDLFACGAILIRRREAGLEVYDLAERVLPGCRRDPLPLEERLRALVGRALRILAPVTRPIWSQVLDGIGSRTRLGLTAMKREKRRLMAAMLAEGEVIQARLESPHGVYLLPADWQPAADEPPARPRVALLSPLDPVIWDRQRAHDLFGFDWRQGSYRAALDRRQFSAPALAVLYGGALVGRLKPQVSWPQRRLVVHALHLTDRRLADEAHFRAALAAALHELAAFHEVDDVQPGSPLLRRLLSQA